MKKINALIPEIRQEECSHKDKATGVRYGRYTGTMPCTGTYACYMCGTELKPFTTEAV